MSRNKQHLCLICNIEMNNYKSVIDRHEQTIKHINNYSTHQNDTINKAIYLKILDNKSLFNDVEIEYITRRLFDAKMTADLYVELKKHKEKLYSYHIQNAIILPSSEDDNITIPDISGYKINTEVELDDTTDYDEDGEPLPYLKFTPLTYDEIMEIPLLYRNISNKTKEWYLDCRNIPQVNRYNMLITRRDIPLDKRPLTAEEDIEHDRLHRLINNNQSLNAENVIIYEELSKRKHLAKIYKIKN